MTLEKLIIGTANFGLNYGINNKNRLSNFEITRIFKLCASYNISVFDTAKGYGDSHDRLINGNINNPKIITKLTIDEIVALSDNSTFEQQVKLTGKIYGLLVHNGQDFNIQSYKVVAKTCEELKEKKIIEKWGLSIYQPSILNDLFPVQIPDIIQVPFNLLDKRLMNGDWPELFLSSGVEIHARSVFLQGILLRNKSNYPEFLTDNWVNVLNAWDDHCKGDIGLKLKYSIEHVLAQHWISKLVIGIDSADHLQQIIDILVKAKHPRELNGEFYLDDDKLLDPSNWRLNK